MHHYTAFASVGKIVAKHNRPRRFRAAPRSEAEASEVFDQSIAGLSCLSSHRLMTGMKGSLELLAFGQLLQSSIVEDDDVAARLGHHQAVFAELAHDANGSFDGGAGHIGQVLT